MNAPLSPPGPSLRSYENAEDHELAESAIVPEELFPKPDEEWVFEEEVLGQTVLFELLL
jgi:hypothetical protein